MKAMDSKIIFWVERILHIFLVLFLLFDGVTHVMQISPVINAFAQLGYSANLSLLIGIIELCCLALYVYPQTAVLGAILLTGYLGGAVASNLRVGLPLFSHVLFPVYTGILIWGGLFIRNKKMRDMIPFIKKHE